MRDPAGFPGRSLPSLSGERHAAVGFKLEETLWRHQRFQTWPVPRRQWCSPHEGRQESQMTLLQTVTFPELECYPSDDRFLQSCSENDPEHALSISWIYSGYSEQKWECEKQLAKEKQQHSFKSGTGSIQQTSLGKPCSNNHTEATDWDISREDGLPHRWVSGFLFLREAFLCREVNKSPLLEMFYLPALLRGGVFLILSPIYSFLPLCHRVRGAAWARTGHFFWGGGVTGNKHAWNLDRGRTPIPCSLSLLVTSSNLVWQFTKASLSSGEEGKWFPSSCPETISPLTHWDITWPDF